MIHPQDLFTQFGGGREGFWDESAWLAVLGVLADHDGEPYTQRDNPALFTDLENALAPLNQKRNGNQQLHASGQDESRSVFRAAGDIWVDTKVAEFSGNQIHVTSDGAAVLAGERTYRDCLRRMFATYREKRNGKSPFIPVLRHLSAHQAAPYSAIFDQIQRECGNEMDDWLKASALQGFPYDVTAKAGNPRRSVLLVLRLLTESGLIAKSQIDETWQIQEAGAVQQVLKEFNELSQSSDLLSSNNDLEIPAIVQSIRDVGWAFEPWQIAAFCHAVRTKPFVILAGISGTGKTKLPHLVAQATGAKIELIPVRPDWRDSSDVLGYTDILGRFHVGPLLRIAHEAIENPSVQHFVVLDEMNLARVEHYFAEVLSKIEDRFASPHGGFQSSPLLTAAMEVRDEDNEGSIPWKKVYLPPNLAIIGSVNMDETTHGFSRKVLDRAFVIEFSDVNLKDYGDHSQTSMQTVHHSSVPWTQTVARIGDHPDSGAPTVLQAIEELEELNRILSGAQLQVGYRVRDEVVLFALEALDSTSMTRSNGEPVNALDLVLCMKVLPRIQGGGSRMKSLLSELASWASQSTPPKFPMCLERIEMLQSRLKNDGFTNFWL